jgi:hypothetical protein
MNEEALIRVADKLDGIGPYALVGPVPTEKFDMQVWTCGTSACACGHAALDPWFIERGFEIKEVPNSHTNASWKTISFKDSQSYDAAATFFGISVDEAAFLFDPSEYRDEDGVKYIEDDDETIVPREVVSARIRKFVASAA